MSEFLFVIPEGWIQIDIEASGMSGETITSILSSSQYQSITEMLRVNNLIGAEDTVMDARLFDNTVFIIKL